MAVPGPAQSFRTEPGVSLCSCHRTVSARQAPLPGTGPLPPLPGTGPVLIDGLKFKSLDTSCNINTDTDTSLNMETGFGIVNHIPRFRLES